MQISDELAERLETVARLKGVDETEIVEQALDRFLCLNDEHVDENPILKRLNSIESQLNQVERNLKIVNEVAALHVRYHLTVSPPLSQSQLRAACQVGFERFEVLAEQVGRRVAQDQPLLQETIDRLRTSERESSGDEIEIRATSAVAETDEHAATVVKAELELSAVAQEGDGYGNFRTKLQNPFCGSSQ
jgi:hypothetical protein